MRDAAGAAVEPLTARDAWSLRVRRIGGLIQAAFAGFWLIRGGLVLGGVASVFVSTVAVLAVGVAVGYGIRVSARIARRPVGSEAREIERAITIATFVQLAASFLAPAIVIIAGHPDWTLPSIAITIGPLLLWLDNRVRIPRYRPVGWALIVGPVLLASILSGTALTAAAGLAAGSLLLATAAAGFHDLALSRGSVTGFPGSEVRNDHSHVSETHSR